MLLSAQCQTESPMWCCSWHGWGSKHPKRVAGIGSTASNAGTSQHFLVTQCSHHHAHVNPFISQALQRGKMWLLLVALCLAQGLGNAIPRTGASHDNPEQFMNIVSARGSNPPLMRPGLPQVVCPKSSPRDQLGSPHPFPWHLHLGSAGRLGAPSFLFLHGCHSLHALSLRLPSP